ncbi:MAG: AbrB/MazE/SpoVT family DNA-binding domain-containing protein [Alphaproteobacteria bacterium]|nr:AbrB/MazE/SpoVT family DNA-binding domain-containing protein [Alphaproteobacteria bacterium]
MTVVKVRPIGNALGVVLPQDVLTCLNVTDGDSLFLTVAADGSVRISPYDPDYERQMRAAQEGMAQYRNALRELAK